jgi:CHAD domain-containing protein
VLPRDERRARRRELQALRRALGAAREAQAGPALLRERLAHLPETARVGGGFVLERLERREKKRERDAARACSRERITRISRRLRRTLRAAVARGPVDPAWLADAHHQLATRVTKAHATLEAAIGSGTDEALHTARLAVKRARYTTEALSGIEPAAQGGAAAGFAAVQEALGRIQDIALLRARLHTEARRIAGGPPAEALLAIERDLERERVRVLAGLPTLLRELPQPRPFGIIGPAA